MSKIYNPSEFANRLGVTTRTLRRWDIAGKLVAKRRPNGHRYYDESDVRSYLGTKEKDQQVVVYCRVSSNNQKNDLTSQIAAMAQNNGCKIVVVNQESLSPQQEMVEDLMAIVHTFSCRLYGLRKYQKLLKEVLTQPKEHNESHTHSH